MTFFLRRAGVNHNLRHRTEIKEEGGGDGEDYQLAKQSFFEIYRSYRAFT